MLFRQDFPLDFFNNRFQDILTKKKEYHGEYELMDFGIGEEQTMPDNGIISSLQLALSKSQNHKYTDRGIDGLKSTMKEYLYDSFHVDVSLDEIAMTMGTKEGLAILPSFLVHKDDYVITTHPGYVVLEKASILYGAKVISLHLKEENDYLPDLSLINENIWEKVKIFSINYPNNPTGAIGNVDFYKKLIRLAHKYHFLIVNDAAYLEYTYADKPLSILSIEGAKECCVELYTLSKSHNMTGYRIGFMAGSSRIIDLYTKVSDIFDSGQFAPIEYAAIYGLKHHEITTRLKNKYYIRMENIAHILNENGFITKISKGTYYLYAKIPTFFKNAHDCALFLLERLGIMTIPYDDWGAFIRLSMTYQCDNELAFYVSFNNRLKALKDIFC